jgi:UDP-N-acetylmuramate--alanine ligase
VSRGHLLGRTRAIHCVGVGGSGMSAIAEVLLRLGYRVSGSDAVPSDVTGRLASLGLEFHAGHAPGFVGEVDVVVVSAAVRPNNAEVVEAHRRNIPVLARADMLAALMRSRFGIAVAGTHGKTTTTSMIALMLDRAGLDPTAVIGGRLAAFGSNARVGQSEYFVAEADESDRSFLRLRPAIAVVTNIDHEHLESYTDFDELTQAFVRFANEVPFYGAAVACIDDPPVRRIRPSITARTVTYGIESQDAEIAAADLNLHASGSTLVVHCGHSRQNERLGTLTLHVAGRHNVLNALAAVGVGLEVGLTFPQITAGLEAFRGAERRFELKGDVAGVRVIDDYGHHPTEIAAVLQAARQSHHGRVIVVFQPHRYTRTARLLDTFGPALAAADLVVLTDIYAAGEDPLPGVTIDALASAVEEAAPGRVHLVKALSEVPLAVARLTAPGDLVITVGAGSIGAVGPRILEEVARCR